LTSINCELLNLGFTFFAHFFGSYNDDGEGIEEVRKVEKKNTKFPP
jgi:hypothetical protein